MKIKCLNSEGNQIEKEIKGIKIRHLNSEGIIEEKIINNLKIGGKTLSEEIVITKQYNSGVIVKTGFNTPFSIELDEDIAKVIYIQKDGYYCNTVGEPIVNAPPPIITTNANDNIIIGKVAFTDVYEYAYVSVTVEAILKYTEYTYTSNVIQLTAESNSFSIDRTDLLPNAYVFKANAIYCNSLGEPIASNYIIEATASVESNKITGTVKRGLGDSSYAIVEVVLKNSAL